MAKVSGRVWSPVITPFGRDMIPDTSLFVNQCQWLTSHGVGLAPFGTNSEANSLSVKEKQCLLAALVEAGVDPIKVLPGTGHCNVDDTVTLTKDALLLGCSGVLMLPPFYYKGVSDEGLFRFYSDVINSIGDDRLRIYLYHIPQVAHIPLSLALIERLRKAFPNAIVGIKDSGGDWEHTKELIKCFGDDGFHVFAGSEKFLLDTLREGGAGCISPTANINPAPIAELAVSWEGNNADLQQQNLNTLRSLFEQYPMIPAMKAATAHYSGLADWRRVRPPLVELNEAGETALIEELRALGFTMNGL